jgi:hypothetical protein
VRKLRRKLYIRWRRREPSTASAGTMWPFGEGKKKTDMSAKSRITCYNNRDAYFECMGKTAPASIALCRCSALH